MLEVHRNVFVNYAIGRSTRISTKRVTVLYMLPPVMRRKRHLSTKRTTALFKPTGAFSNINIFYRHFKELIHIPLYLQQNNSSTQKDRAQRSNNIKTSVGQTLLSSSGQASILVVVMFSRAGLAFSGRAGFAFSGRAGTRSLCNIRALVVVVMAGVGQDDRGKQKEGGNREAHRWVKKWLQGETLAFICCKL